MLNPTTTDQAGLANNESARCCSSQRGPSDPWRMILLGAPGVGKGTQADLLKARLGVIQLSTGEIFRSSMKQPAEKLSPVMREAVRRVREGLLVTDDTVINIFKEHKSCLHHPKGVLLDGFPRTIPQAEALEQILKNEGVKLDAVLNYELPIEMVVSRIAGRRVCTKCKKSYHVKEFPPAKEGVCDACGAPLCHRDDDKPEAVRVRLHTYERETSPLIEYYKKKGLLVEINCSGTPTEVFDATLKALGIA